MDDDHIEDLVRIGASPDGLARARSIAAKALADEGLPPFPKNACAATLSALLQLASIDVRMTLGAGKLAYILGGVGASSRHWVHILVGDQKPGDVGVTFDEDPKMPGADHIYLVVERIDSDAMVVADNQGTGKHIRHASGNGRTPTEYFLRAPPRPKSEPARARRRSLPDDIARMAGDSAIAHYQWSQRGRAPQGFIKGMAVAYADALLRLRGGDPFAVELAKAARSGDRMDALTWFAGQFAAAGMRNDADGVATMRHAFVLLTGLGMRESSGRACEGRDRNVKNPTADTAEAGAFQASYDLHTAHPLIPKAISLYQGTDALYELFMEGVHAKPEDLENIGTGAGRDFQVLMKSCPAAAVLVAGIGMRHRRSHWGPLTTRSAEIVDACDRLFQDVEKLVDAGPAATPIVKL